jgi:hypothetical protein
MKIRMRVLGIVVGAAALMATGCGNLTIRSWVKVITDESTGSLTTALAPDPVPLVRVQGGFLGAITLDTRSLPAPLDGTISVDDVRIQADTLSLIGAICIWGNPAVPSKGTVHLDVLGGTGATTLNLSVKAQAGIGELFGLPPVELSQSSTLPLNGLGITQLLNASSTGSSDGLFATTASFVGDTEVLGAPATFALDMKVTNSSTPPSFDADMLVTCDKYFDEQGRDLFFGVNTKGSYLRAAGSDQPVAPTIIKLSDIGAVPGNTLKIARVGTYNDATELRDGNATKVGAVFSSTNVVLNDNQRNRIPGAIDAGTDVSTGSILTCIIFPFCTSTPTDIAQDFAVTNSPTVTIPAGAQYLIVAPIPDSLKWGDNSGFGLGVALTVNP